MNPAPRGRLPHDHHPSGVTPRRAQGGPTEHKGWLGPVLPGAGGAVSVDQGARGPCLAWDELTQTHASHPTLSEPETEVLGIIALLSGVRTSMLQMQGLRRTAGSIPPLPNLGACLLRGLSSALRLLVSEGGGQVQRKGKKHTVSKELMHTSPVRWVDFDFFLMTSMQQVIPHPVRHRCGSPSPASRPP